MPRLIARSLSFSFVDAAPVLDRIDLALDPGWWAVVGENGAGKTTLLRLLSGELRPQSGVARLEPEGATLALCPQVVDERPPGAPALADDDGGEARALRATLALDPDDLARWPTLSPGERKRWQVATALHPSPDLLLLDEPTNHLDASARRSLVRALRRHRGLGVVVTHDRDLMAALEAGTIQVQRGEVRATRLGWDEARVAWEAERRRAEVERGAWRDDVARRERALADARRTRDQAESGVSSRSRMKSAQDHDGREAGRKGRAAFAEKRAGRVVGVRRGELDRARAAEPPGERRRDLGRSVFIAFEPCPSPRLAHLDATSIRAGEREVLRDVRVQLGRGDRIRVAGDNGSGKTTLVNALLGAAAPSARIAVVPQELDAGARAAHLADVRGAPPAERGRVLSLLAALGADPDRVLASQAPSPGEARKLAIARALGSLAHAVVLDEPTNHLDLPSVERVEAALAAFPGALLLVTHDDRLASALTARTWTVAGGRVEV